MCLPRLILFSTLVMTATAAHAQAQQNADSTDAQALATLTQRVDQLVADLGSQEFSRRQKAAVEIQNLDASAVAMLESSAQSASRSVADQLNVLIPRIRKRTFDDRLEKLKASPTVSNAVGLPDWDRFAEIAGEDALPVYIELLDAERDLFASRQFNSPDFASRLKARSEAFVAQCTGLDEPDFPIANCAALMLLGSNPKLSLSGGTSTNISTALRNSQFKKLLREGVHSETLTAILAAWMTRPNIAVDQPLLFSIEHKLPVGRTIAMQTLAGTAQHPRTTYSLLCLGAFNQKEDLAVVEKMMTTARKAWPPAKSTVQEYVQGRKVESTYSVQLRDVALAVAIHLRGGQHSDFGMEVSPSEIHLFTVDSMGFDNEDARNAAFQKYHATYLTPASAVRN